MEARGLIARVHGGALALNLQEEPPVLQRKAQQASCKQHIAAAAANLVRDGEMIVITGGTTTEAMVPFLAPRRNITVVTNALNLAAQFSRYPQVEVVVLGGWLRHAELSLVGHLTAQALAEFHPDRTFSGVFGLGPEIGLTGANVQEAQTDRQIIASARQLIILADHTKFYQVGAVRLGPAEAAAVVITDDQAPPECLASFAAQGIQVIIA
jgi:DeoR/GlpR family transcriptional regulator of sugar metabolism